jgi:hypothetical protein
MSRSDQQRQFLDQHHAAAMVTLRANGTPHVAQVGVVVVDGKLWSSGTQGRVRTRHLRRDPRCTRFVFDPPWRWLGLETTEEFLQTMVEEERLIYEFEISRPYGLL